jgi:hypothetical protein
MWEDERELLREARQHGYESWAEYMAAEGNEFVRDSWQGPAERERNKLVRRLRQLFSRRCEGYQASAMFCRSAAAVELRSVGPSRHLLGWVF